MLTLYCLTLIGLLPSHHTSTPAQPCCTHLKTPVLYAQSSRLAEPGLRHGFLTEYGATNLAVPGSAWRGAVSPGNCHIQSTRGSEIAVSRAGAPYACSNHYS